MFITGKDLHRVTWSSVSEGWGRSSIGSRILLCAQGQGMVFLVTLFFINDYYAVPG